MPDRPGAPEIPPEGESRLDNQYSGVKKRVIEESVLFISVTKWFFLASLTGVLVAFAVTGFLKVLDWSIAAVTSYKYYYFFLPLSLFAASFLVRLVPGAAGHGTNKVIEAVHLRFGKVKPFVVLMTLVGTLVTIATGGSAGKECPGAQVGAGVSSLFSDIFRLRNEDRRKLVICGISAGFAVVFGTPIGGAIFGVEVLFMGEIVYEVLFPSFVAGIVGFQVALHLGVPYMNEPVIVVPEFSQTFFLTVCLSGVFFGLCAFLFIELRRYIKKLRLRANFTPGLWAIIGGCALVLISVVFTPRYLGLGLDTISEAIAGERLPLPAPFLKMLTASITLSLGGSGGIVTPIFFAGATSGNLFAQVLGLDLSVFSAIGMVGLLAGAANTPISASIMAVELFGPSLAPYAAIACVISFLMVGHRCVFPSQILSVSKSASIQIEKGIMTGEIRDVHVSPHSMSVLGAITWVTGKIRALRKGGREP